MALLLDEKRQVHWLTKDNYINSVLRDLDVDRQLVYEDEAGNKFVKQANSKVDKV